ncbi:hypothetical protein AZF37_04410 [endosymbiont 'TC1' of Trimyema compressum]|uniref:B12-binding domain-containing radical SAM protein n=1 Tax=endosymbiont 'TC1' of Trimyema compressum TaxID=243899 RepID=UPI0007F112AF|nr:B12-binding domain-containing radical SAM protein [endosymbiont 'TC1' of Trimyema compressum]AMP20511.1 hypothetical protein AZF37_04410 [endosymbiont 'TC1' of Trimyema compressum]
MKVLLVGINTRYIHKNLAIDTLFNYSQGKYNHELRRLESSIHEPIDKLFQKIVEVKSQVICFSTYIWNKEIILKLAESIKRILPNTAIVLGGPEISKDYLSYEYIDHLLVGEGELIFDEFLKNNCTGLQLIENKDIYIDLDKLPFPYELDCLEHKIVYYEGSRGCPFKCSYCLSGEDNVLRLKSPKHIKEEIKALLDAGVNQVKFVDRTFNAHPKWALEVAKTLLQFADYKCNFHFEVSIDKVSSELIDFFQLAPVGLFQLEVGIQSTNYKTLEAVGRLNNFNKIKEHCKDLIKEGNIHVHTDIIAGLPLEDLQSFQQSFNNVYQIYGHIFQVGFLKVIPNTRLKREGDKWGIVYRSYPPYEVLETADLSVSDLFKIKYVEEGVDVFYNTAYFRQTFLYLKNKIDNFFIFFEKLGELYFHREDQLGIEEKFEFLMKFIKNNCANIDTHELLSIMTIDWHLNHRHKKEPLFLLDAQLQMKPLLAYKDEIQKYGISKDRLKWLKIIKLPFEYVIIGTDGVIGRKENTFYLLDYEKKQTIYGYPEMNLIEEKLLVE